MVLPIPERSHFIRLSILYALGMTVAHIPTFMLGIIRMQRPDVIIQSIISDTVLGSSFLFIAWIQPKAMCSRKSQVVLGGLYQMALFACGWLGGQLAYFTWTQQGRWRPTGYRLIISWYFTEFPAAEKNT